MNPRRTHPWVFLVLILPFGVMSGYLTVTIAYLLSKAGISVGQVAALVALSFVPHTWKFAWAPIVDTTLSRKTWYAIAGVVSAAGIWATGVFRADSAHLAMLSMIVLASNVAVTFLGMSVDGLMAYCTPENEKGRAGGWFQAGNLGGNGVGGGAGLWLAQILPAPWMAGAILGVMCLACLGGLWFVDEPHSAHREGGLSKSLINVAKDLWSMSRMRTGILSLVLCVLPIGSGAASGLWSAVAGDWRASAGTVALVTGVLGGVVSAIGCLLGGWLCDRMHRRTAYAAYGLLQALCAVGMAMAPRTEMSYVVFTLVYALITGLTYAGFTAFVLEAIGMGAAATKYNVMASLSNTPIFVMTQVDGWAHTRWGPAGMLYAEAVGGAIGLVVFIVVTALVPSRKPDPTAPVG